MLVYTCVFIYLNFFFHRDCYFLLSWKKTFEFKIYRLNNLKERNKKSQSKYVIATCSNRIVFCFILNGNLKEKKINILTIKKTLCLYSYCFNSSLLRFRLKCSTLSHLLTFLITDRVCIFACMTADITVSVIDSMKIVMLDFRNCMPALYEFASIYKYKMELSIYILVY